MKKPEPIVWLLISASVLRLAWLTAAPLWYDEAFTVVMLSRSLADLLQATAGDVHPPGYYLLLWPLARTCGASALCLRLPSVLAGVLSIWLFWLILNELQLDCWTRYAAAIWMAVAPFQLYFSQEARMYQVLQAIILAGVLAVLRRRWYLFGLANLAMLLLHNYSLFYLATMFGLAIWQEGRMSGQVMASITLPVLAWLPWVGILLQQMSIVSTGYWIEPASIGSLVFVLVIYIFGDGMDRFVLVALLVASGWLVWASVQNMRGRQAWLLPTAWLMLAPLAGALLASAIWKPLFLFRALIASTPFLYLWLLAPLGRLSGWRRWYAGVFVLPILAAGLIGYWTTGVDRKEFLNAALPAIEWQNGDIAYATNDGMAIAWLVYGNGGTLYLMPECNGHHDRGALSPLTRSALGIQQAELADIDASRVWLLLEIGPTTDDCHEEKALKLMSNKAPVYTIRDDPSVLAGVWLLLR